MEDIMTDRQKLGIFLMGFGAFIGLCGWSMFGQGKKGAYDTETWAEVEAKIISSEVETVSMHNPSDRGPSNVTGWEPAITYRYNFKGKDYEGNQYTISSSASRDHDKATSIVRAHPTGSTATVYVNPEKPSEAVLSREDRGASAVIFIVGSVLVPVGIIMLIAGGAVYLLYRRT